MKEMQKTDLSGIWRCKIPGMSGEMRIPGTLDEAGIGFPDDPKKQWQIDEVRRIGFYRDGDPIVTRLTRKVSYEGMARITRTVSWQPAERISTRLTSMTAGGAKRPSGRRWRSGIPGRPIPWPRS